MITIDNLKQCGTCKEWKPATNQFFANKKTGVEGLTSRCKSCYRKWYKTHSEQVKERSRKRYEENSELIKELNRKRYEENSELIKERSRKWNEANRERKKEYCRKWQKANPEKRAARNQKRRALKANADGSATAEQIKARFQYHENRCYYCGDNESCLHIEHRIPLSRGGSNWPANLVPSCPSCNLQKGTKTETEFKK